jgi:hypothetical protein
MLQCLVQNRLEVPCTTMQEWVMMRPEEGGPAVSAHHLSYRCVCVRVWFTCGGIHRNQHKAASTPLRSKPVHSLLYTKHGYIATMC